MPRILLKIEYAGECYHGWQRQEGYRTIQSVLEEALAKFLCVKVNVIAAGRTDKGVHASGQVIHFDTSVSSRALYAYICGLNHFLPQNVRVTAARETTPDFHARFSATYRRYEMRILNRRVDSALLSGRVLFHPLPLDEALMQQGANFLLGKHDFSSFRARDCQARSPVKHLQLCQIERFGDRINITLQASGFLHKMVRNITGVLLKIGEGARPPLWAQEVLNARNREKGAKTVAPHGLYLTEIGYDEDPFTEDLPR